MFILIFFCLGVKLAGFGDDASRVVDTKSTEVYGEITEQERVETSDGEYIYHLEIEYEGVETSFDLTTSNLYYQVRLGDYLLVNLEQGMDINGKVITEKLALR